jgi:hypothetical protein
VQQPHDWIAVILDYESSNGRSSGAIILGTKFSFRLGSQETDFALQDSLDWTFSMDVKAS